MSETAETLQNEVLRVESLDAGYEGKMVVSQISFSASRGELVTMIGRNGTGKSTILKTIMGLLEPLSGRILFEEDLISGMLPEDISSRGVSICLQDRRVFMDLSVRENLELAGLTLQDSTYRERSEGVLDRFPIMREMLARQAGDLSLGEQQILSLSRALIQAPRLLLLDEPSQGLAPEVLSILLQTLSEITTGRDTAIVLAEHRISQFLNISDKVVALDEGRLQYAGDQRTFARDEELRNSVL